MFKDLKMERKRKNVYLHIFNRHHFCCCTILYFYALCNLHSYM